MRLFLALLLFSPFADDGAVSGKIAATEGASQKKLRDKLKYVGPGAEARKAPDPSLAVVWLEGAPSAKAEPRSAEIVQRGLECRPRVVAIPTGSTISFPNGDDVFHNLFSYSKVKRFDLGRYPKGESKSVTFDAPGRVDIRCEVHDHLRCYIHVFDHPWFAVAAEDGTYALPKVPPGKYTLHVWKEFFSPYKQEIEVKADGAKVDATLTLLPDRPADRKAGAACCDAR